MSVAETAAAVSSVKTIRQRNRQMDRLAGEAKPGRSDVGPNGLMYLNGKVDKVRVLLDYLLHPGRLGELLALLLQMDRDLRPATI